MASSSYGGLACTVHDIIAYHTNSMKITCVTQNGLFLNSDYKKVYAKHRNFLLSLNFYVCIFFGKILKFYP